MVATMGYCGYSLGHSECRLEITPSPAFDSAAKKGGLIGGVIDTKPARQGTDRF